MRTRRRNRYYCDFCKKSGCSAFYMKKHEDHCTMNPNRKCGMCEVIGNTPHNLPDLISLLPNPEEYLTNHEKGDFSFEIFTGLEEAVNSVLNDLYEKTEGCPACILAALRQAKIPVPMITKFNFTEACNDFWKQFNEDK